MRTPITISKKNRGQRAIVSNIDTCDQWGQTRQLLLRCSNYAHPWAKSMGSDSIDLG